MRLRLVHDLIRAEQATAGGPENIASGPPAVWLQACRHCRRGALQVAESELGRLAGLQVQNGEVLAVGHLSVYPAAAA